MGEEFQGGVCGGNWLPNSSRNLFGTSPCLSTINDMCSFRGLSSSQLDPLTVRSTDDLVSSVPYSNCCVQVQDVAKIQEQMGVSDHNWNQDFLNNTGKSDENYSQEAAALNPSMNFCEDFSTNSLNPDFALEQDSFYSLTNNNSTQCPEFPLNSASYGYTSSSLLQTMFESDSQPHELLNNRPTNYSPAANCPMINDFSPILTKSSPSHLKFTYNTPFCNSNVSILNNVRPNFPPSTQSQFILPHSNDAKLNITNFTRKHRNEEAGKMAKKAINEPAIKRPRIETPSPLPTFKVRKEKLGDRVTALQQLVSPFGKTDTASVLHEAIDYIKFLHDQVGVLSAPYLKNRSQMQGQQATDQEGLKQDLRSRGLCLVPITSTFPVATEPPTDFWTPTFGGCFRKGSQTGVFHKYSIKARQAKVRRKVEKEVIQQEDSRFLGHVMKSRKSLLGHEII